MTEGTYLSNVQSVTGSGNVCSQQERNASQVLGNQPIKRIGLLPFSTK